MSHHYECSIYIYITFQRTSICFTFIEGTVECDTLYLWQTIKSLHNWTWSICAGTIVWPNCDVQYLSKSWHVVDISRDLINYRLCNMYTHCSHNKESNRMVLCNHLHERNLHQSPDQAGLQQKMLLRSIHSEGYLCLLGIYLQLPHHQK
jgi:hypothetical protein